MAHGYERMFAFRKIKESNKSGRKTYQTALAKLGYSAGVGTSSVEVTLREYEWWASMIGGDSEGNNDPVPLPDARVLDREAKKAGVTFDPKSKWMLDYEC